MSGAVLVLLLVAIGTSFFLYLLIENETADPTIVDRSEAERMAKRRGGRPEERRNAAETGRQGTAGVGKRTDRRGSQPLDPGERQAENDAWASDREWGSTERESDR